MDILTLVPYGLECLSIFSRLWCVVCVCVCVCVCFGVRLGFWSEAWARRTVSWHEHVMRTTGVMRSLVMFKNSDWLEAQRSHFVVETGSSASRNSLTAGRTGTRCNIGKPQMRWQACIALARGFFG